AQVLGFADLPLSFTGAATVPASLDRLLDLIDLLALDRRTRGKSERLLEFITTAATQPATINVARFSLFAESALGWPATLVTALVPTPGGMGIIIPDDAPRAVTWRRLIEAVQAIRKIGLPPAEAFALTREVPIANDAALARQAMRARFGTAGFKKAMRPVQN